MTHIEDRMEQFIKGLQYHYIREHKIIDTEFEYQVDFFLPEFNVVIECDGEIYHRNKHPDNVKDKNLLKIGIEVIRFHGRTILKHPNDVVRELKKIKKAI